MNKKGLLKVIKKDLEEYMVSGKDSLIRRAEENHGLYLELGGRKRFQTIKNNVMREVANSQVW